jgi:probable phosphoglycerate mutase
MRDTGSNALGADASGAGLLKTLDWLQEFPAQVDPGAAELLQDAFCFKKNADGSPKNRVVWDMYPAYYHEHPAYSDYNEWRTTPVALHSDAVSVYDRIIRSFDEFLAERGYVREGRHYRVERENTETITFFCHFGVSCVLLSRLWNVSPFVPLQSLCMPTSSVTELYTEERQKGIAHFRTTRIGDTTHLTMAGLKPERLPHSALFAEVYSDFSQRHD